MKKKFDLIGQDVVFRNVVESARKVKGHHDVNILITGETGTGKGELAKFIHSLEEDPNRPFVHVNCAAIPETMIESELFGHEKGAFTGATATRIGKFKNANGGDIVLDEINTLKPELQAKLLRTLQEREIDPLGGSTIQLDFRAIAIANEDIEKLVRKGQFRADLFERLTDLHLHLPSLRARKSDLEQLINHFLKKYLGESNKKEIDPNVVELLKQYDWPGNIRQLEKAIKRAVIMSKDKDFIDVSHLPERIINATCDNLMLRNANGGESWVDSLGPWKQHVEGYEKEAIRFVLKSCGNNLSKAARILQIPKTTLHDKIKALGLFDQPDESFPPC